MSKRLPESEIGDYVVGLAGLFSYTLNAYEDLFSPYTDLFKAYHNIDHIEYCFSKLDDEYILEDWRQYRKGSLDERFLGLLEKTTQNEQIKNAVVLGLAIIYHDIVYYPWKNDNEEKSREYFGKVMEKLFPLLKGKNTHVNYERILSNIIQDAGTIILRTKVKYSDRLNSFSPLVEEMFRVDYYGLLNEENFSKVVDYEQNISKEYSFVPHSEYKKKRIEFLEELKNSGALPTPSIKQIEHLIEYVRNRKLNVGIYAGSFNPWHIGHQNVLKQAKELFDKVVVLVATNPEKNKPEVISANAVKYPKDITQLQSEIKRVNPEIEVDVLNHKFLHSYIQERESQDAENITLIRGLRNATDLSNEINYIKTIRDFYPSLKVVYVHTNYEHVSSSMIRAIQSIDKDSAKQYLP